MTFVKFKNSSFNSFPTISRNFNFPSIFNDSFDRLCNDEAISRIPSANIIERVEDFKIDLAVPGIEKKDFKIGLEKNILTISGERKEETIQNEKEASREFYYGGFKRAFSLPEIADYEKISASYNNGILTVIVAKKEELKEKSKKEIIVE